jgi:hypothetical protein
MKKVFLFIVFSILYVNVFAQTDTLKIGSLLVIKPIEKKSMSWKEIVNAGEFKDVKINRKKKVETNTSQFQTNWFGFDLGLSNYIDETKYELNKTLYNPAIGLPLSKYKMSLNNSKSTNVNIWILQQKYNFKKPGTYLKYSIGFEMFNFRYEYPINYRENEAMFIYLSDSSYEKNKLLTTYLSAPIQLGYDYKLKNNKTIGFSGGIILGYLYKATNKQISRSLGKEKYYGDFSMRDLRLAGIFEIRIDKLKFFGTASLTNMLDKMPTNQSLYPYSFGLRFSKF